MLARLAAALFALGALALLAALVLTGFVGAVPPPAAFADPRWATLRELALLYAATLATNLTLPRTRARRTTRSAPGGLLAAGVDLLLPLLFVLGLFGLVHAPVGGGLAGVALLVAALLLLHHADPRAAERARLLIDALAGLTLLVAGAGLVLASDGLPLSPPVWLAGWSWPALLPPLTVALGLKVAALLAELLAWLDAVGESR